jgi:uncharacterized protein (DUF1501 family)
MTNRPPKSIARRRFLNQAAAWAGINGIAASPLVVSLQALAAAAEPGNDYRAIVCVFLYGGNDSANMVLATDPASWQSYLDFRSNGPEPIALLPPGTAPDPTAAAASPLALGGVLPISPRHRLSALNTSRTFALHPTMSAAANLFESGRLSVVANVGALVEPVTRDAFERETAKLPPKLFSHNDQAAIWQALAVDKTLGWGGKLGDSLSAANAQSSFTSISTAGNVAFLAGETVVPYITTPEGAVAISGIQGPLFGSTLAAQQLRLIATATGTGHLMAQDHASIVKRSIDLQATFQSAFNGSQLLAPTDYWSPLTRSLRGSNLAKQLQTVARIISMRTVLGQRRQVFFVGIGGFDTHDNQNRSHGDLLARLSHGLGYFDEAMGSLGTRDSVVLFTASDFGRSFSSNGDGTDHGWGGHHFVMSGETTLRGGEIIGRFPALGIEHAEAVNSGALIPAISIEQLGATIGRWFGCSENNIDLVFPNLRNFGSGRNLGFLN